MTVELMEKRALWRYFVAPLVALALIVGYVAYTQVGSRDPAHPAGAPAPAPAAKKLTAADLLLAASTAKGIHLQVDLLTGGPGTVHTNHVNIGSFQWGVGATASGPGGTSRPTISEFTMTKSTDKFTLPLLARELRGQVTRGAIVYFTGVDSVGADVDYLEFDLKNVTITGLSMSSGGDNPNESLSLSVTGFTIKAHIAGAPAQTLTYDIPTNTTS
jgi:type VI secretion system secreted protein Hcp